MNRTALIVAVLMGSAGVALLYLYKQNFEAQAAGGRPVSVLMVRKNIEPGTRLSEDALGVRQIPESYVDERHVRAGQVQSVVGVRVTNALKPNDTLSWADLAVTSGPSRNLADLVRVGMRAVSVPVDDQTFGGLMRPGDRVDVLLSYQSRAGRSTAVLAQNVLILAIGSSLGNAGDGSGGGRGGGVTLLVATEQAQRLTVAQGQGSIGLVLRNPDDVRVSDKITEAALSDVLGSSPAHPLDSDESVADAPPPVPVARAQPRAAKARRLARSAPPPPPKLEAIQ